MKKIMVMALAALAMVSSLSLADVPQGINLQGRLTDNTGVPLPDGNYSITVGLYTQASGGSAAWSDLFNTPTKNGYFNIILGKDGTAKPFTGVNFDQQLYAGIKVGLDGEMTPRQPLSTVPYAMNVADNAVATSKLQNGAVTGAKVTTTLGQRLTCNNIEPWSLLGSNISATPGQRITGANIENSAIDQFKAPFAPKVAVDGSWRSAPKIACGKNTTDINGNTHIDLSSYGFTQTPIITCTPIHDSLLLAVTIYSTDLSATGFGVCTRMSSSQGGAVDFMWIAIGY